jgi:hypothetical protein
MDAIAADFSLTILHVKYYLLEGIGLISLIITKSVRWFRSEAGMLGRMH